MKYLIIILHILHIGCSPASEEAQKVSVKSCGALKEIMHQGKFQARVKLDTLAKEMVYGLGAADSLSGELLVLNGEVYEATVVDAKTSVKKNKQALATLFVYSVVKDWDTLTIHSANELESILIAQAKQRGLKEPFPFIMRLSPESLTYHVINFDAKHGDISKHKEGALYGDLSGEKLQILGFYATGAKGIYTHHDSHLHMHVINSKQTVMGHVEELVLGTHDFQLLLPAL